jgi:hypothetical protein
MCDEVDIFLVNINKNLPTDIAIFVVLPNMNMSFFSIQIRSIYLGDSGVIYSIDHQVEGEVNKIYACRNIYYHA